MGSMNEITMEETFWHDLQEDYPVLKAEKVKITTKSISSLVQMAYIAGRAQGRWDCAEQKKAVPRMQYHQDSDVPDAGDIEIEPEARECSAKMSGRSGRSERATGEPSPKLNILFFRIR